MTIEQHRERWLDTCNRIGQSDYQAAGKSAMGRHYLDWMEQALTAGVSVTARDPDGADGWDLLTQSGRGSAGVQPAALRLLVRHGYPVLDFDRLQKLPGALLEPVVDEICTLVNDGKNVLSVGQENVLHVLARMGPERLLCFILPNPSAPAIGRLAGSGTMKTLVEAGDLEGCTPLHTLWQHHGASPDIWMISYFLSHKGGVLDRANEEGHTVAQMIVEAVKSGQQDLGNSATLSLPGLEEVIGGHYAAAQALVLDETIQDPDATRARPRL